MTISHLSCIKQKRERQAADEDMIVIVTVAGDTCVMLKENDENKIKDMDRIKMIE